MPRVSAPGWQHLSDLVCAVLPGTPHAGAKRATLPLAPEVTAEDRALVDNVVKIVEFLSRERSMLQVC